MDLCSLTCENFGASTKGDPIAFCTYSIRAEKRFC